MNKQEILIRKRQCIDVPASKRPRQENPFDPRALTLQAEAMRLGFMLSEPLMRRLSTISDARIGQLYKRIVPVLRAATGDDAATWEPFYPNFPRQVVEASDIELFLNAVIHYWSFGQWRPQFEKETRLPAFEAVEYTMIGLADQDDILSIFAEILGANASVADTDRAVMIEIMDNVSKDKLAAALPESIPFKENLCWFVGECINRGWNLVGMSVLQTATDILRVATHLSGGDISLAENTRFKSFSRPLRRAMVERLNVVVNDDDVFRHRGKWVRLAHSLHIGEYVAPRALAVMASARDSKSSYQTFNAKVEAAFNNNSRKAIVDLLKTRPGVFARRLDHVLRQFGPIGVVRPFLGVADQVDTRVLLQLYGHFNTRTEAVSRRLVFPKGGQGKSRLLRQILPALAEETVDALREGVSSTLEQRFVERDAIGETVYIDPALKDCPVPLSLRSASDSLVTVARGTKLPLGGDKGTIRMFIYWKGDDIDLSGFFVNEDFTNQDTVAYYDLRNNFACHSGDIVNAPCGACEFIDVDIKKALAAGHRYLVMSVLVFYGPNFSDHEVCYAGWMTRNKVKSNEIFDPKTVEQKVDLTCNSQNAIPVIFDLQERKAIWLDLAVSQRYSNLCRPNNVAMNKPCLYDSIEGAMNLGNKPTLYDLFMMHAQARADYITEDPDEADVTFGWNGDVKPTDTTTILSDYLV